jgi:hypothetical protein
MYPSFAAAPKRKVFVSYHHRGDRNWYDAFTKFFCDTYDVIQDNSVEREIDSDNAEYVIRKIREEYITGTSCTIVLCGKDTPGRKFVDWEIKATLDKKHGLIGVRLPTAPLQPGNKINVPDRLWDNINTSFASWVTWEALTSSPQGCSRMIDDAAKKETRYIANDRALRTRNS